MLVESVADMIRGETEEEEEEEEDDDGGWEGCDEAADTAGGRRRRWGRGLTGALYLHVITYNEGAIRLYERLGFVRVKEIKDYYLINSVNYDCYLYARYFHEALKGKLSHGQRGGGGLINEATLNC
ncbi:hypothetical protein ACHAW5_009819 [Stephanodiscus triporus]|uniref:histone acetyltransferase n=1 Tax=Stephanodiscus triporus TaxID=2934178 RepID=A0ABD3PM92_9STRA